MQKHVLLVPSKLCAINHVLQIFLKKFAVFCSTLHSYLNLLKLYTMSFWGMQWKDTIPSLKRSVRVLYQPVSRITLMYCDREELHECERTDAASWSAYCANKTHLCNIDRNWASPPHPDVFTRVCANKWSSNARKRERGRFTVSFICNHKVLYIARIFITFHT